MAAVGGDVAVDCDAPKRGQVRTRTRQSSSWGEVATAMASEPVDVAASMNLHVEVRL